MFKESIKMSWANIINNKMRSFLTILGIVIGVASIIALITLVSGATNSIVSQVNALGANKITVTVMGTPLKPGLINSDIQNLSTIDNINGVSPTISSRTAVAGNNIVMQNITIQGKNDVYFSNTSNLMATGRAINIIDINQESNVCVVGSDIAQGLFYGQSPIGQGIIINGITYTVVGTLQASSGFSFNSNNDTVIIPYTTAMKVLNTKYISSVDLYMTDSSISDTTTQKINSMLLQAFNNKDNSDNSIFSITNMQDMLSTFQTMTGMMSLLLGGIASISLVVGGIGIMNMMLVSVTERTTEIGLRKALGAEPGAIKEQFLLEAIFLSLFGGVIGLGFGVLIALVACNLIGISLSVSAFTVILAIGFSMVVGVVFGLTPASKAAKLNPIDALRSV
ncbi:MAG: ABC transporter permease [Oscillospiraceae bacterium]|nr:ABC transporter permease [Oscillospiraceae bacterium]